jgi:hypothetical protein
MQDKVREYLATTKPLFDLSYLCVLYVTFAHVRSDAF